jgi:hypothetical protein
MIFSRTLGPNLIQVWHSENKISIKLHHMITDLAPADSNSRI